MTGKFCLAFAGEVLFGSFEMKSISSAGGVPAPHFSTFSVGGRTGVSFGSGQFATIDVANGMGTVIGVSI
jgi:hypothetical protein